jgi:hypothetical protein
MFKFPRLEVDTIVHIFKGNHKGETTEGRIVHVFDLPNNLANPYYVIAIDIPSIGEEDYEVRTRLGIRLQPILVEDPNTVYDDEDDED